MNSLVREKWQADVQCAKCNDIIWSRHYGQFVTCKCGAISVDQTSYYTRYIGDAINFKITKKDEQNGTDKRLEGD